MKAKGTDVVVFKSSYRLEGNCRVAGKGVRDYRAIA